MTHPWRRGLALGLSAALVLAIVPGLVDGRGHPDAMDREGFQPDYGQCLKPSQSPEIFGPTDINAQTANGGMAVALNDEATVTVLRYPRPSMYDQVKYHTSDRDAERMGVAPNEGAFLGLSVQVADGSGVSQETTWLRSWSASQTYEDGFRDVVNTTFTHDELGLQVVVRDVVAAPPTDVLARDVEVTREPGSPVRDATLLAFENWNLVVSKYPGFPTRDWCQEEGNRDRARYLAREDAIVHTKSGVDWSVGQARTVAVGMGFQSPSDGHQVGGDAYEPSASPLARGPSPVQDAYDDAADGQLRGNDEYVGHTTGVLARDLDLGGPTITAPVADEATLYVVGGANREDVDDALTLARETGFGGLASEKAAWLDDLLADAPMPADDAPAAVEELSERAVVTLVTNVDRRSKAIVASIATQSPYGQDWPRDGAYFNVALNVLGLHDWVAEHNRWYASIQQKAEDPDPRAPLTPPGNWAMVYYGDGVPGGPIPYEIDETGYGVWTLWRHYNVTGDAAYLEDVYPAIERAADFLVDCKDPSTDLQCHSWEDDNYILSQSIIGAETTWLALQAAEQAALARAMTGGQAYLEDATRYEERREELGAAIDEHLWAEDEEQYGAGDRVTRESRSVTGLPVLPPSTAPAEMAWPVCYDPAEGFDDARMDLHEDAVWDRINNSFDEPGNTAGNVDKDQGLYESKGLLALAKHWKDDETRMDLVRDGLEWVATEHATPDTHVMGEVWVEEDGDIESRVSMPHTWEQILFYMASLEAWPPQDAAGAEAGCGGTLAQITGTASS